MVTRSPSGSWPGSRCSGATKLPMTAEGTAAASGSQLKSAFRAHSDTYTRPSTCGITSRSTCRIARNTVPSRLISLPVGLFVGLGDPEVNCHNHALVWPSPRAQGRPGVQRTLGVDDAVADLGEASAQRVAEEHLMPVPIPDDASGSAASLEYEAKAENG